MLRNKIVRFKNNYKFAENHFFMGVIFFLLFFRNAFIKIKNSIFPPKYTRYEKNVVDNIVHPKKIYRFTSDHFSIGRVVFVLIVKNIIKDEKFHFAPNLCGIRKKC